MSIDVSVLMSAFNHEEFVGAAIESVLAQTHHNWELLIVDDCSVDGTWDVIQRYRDPRISARRKQVNEGASVAYNDALAQSSGRILMTLDSDDAYEPIKIERQLEFLDANPDIGVLGTQVRSQPANAASDDWFNSDVDLNDPATWIWSNRLAHSSVAITRSAHDRIGPAWDKLRMLLDWDLYLRAIAAGIRIATMPDPVTRIRISPQTLTHSDPSRTALEYLSMSEAHWHDHLRRSGRADLVGLNLQLALERLTTLGDEASPGLLAKTQALLSSSPEAGGAGVAFCRSMVDVLADKDNALEAQSAMIEERATLLAHYESTIDRTREEFEWERAAREAALHSTTQQLHQTEDRIARLLPLEVSPKAQVRALRESLPQTIRVKAGNYWHTRKRRNGG